MQHMVLFDQETVSIVLLFESEVIFLCADDQTANGRLGVCGRSMGNVDGDAMGMRRKESMVHLSCRWI